MNTKLKLFLTLKGFDLTEERFYKLNRTPTDLCSLFFWGEQPEDGEFWSHIASEYDNVKIIKSNKLNKKLYPDSKEIDGYIILETE